MTLGRGRRAASVFQILRLFRLGLLLLQVGMQIGVLDRAQGHAALVDGNVGLRLMVQGVDEPQELWYTLKIE